MAIERRQPPSTLAEIEKVNFLWRKGTKVVHVLSLELDMHAHIKFYPYQLCK